MRTILTLVTVMALMPANNAADAGEPMPLLPDLIAWADEEAEYMYGWQLDPDEFPNTLLLRLTSTIANIGAGAIELHVGNTLPDDTQEVFQRIYDDAGGFADRLAGTFVFHGSHNHMHFEGFAQFNLRAIAPGNGVGDVVAGGGKTSFCLVDSVAYDDTLPGAPSDDVYGSTCATLQGISVGWADIYRHTLPDQWIDITGVPDGRYYLEVIADPDDRLVEVDETNNATRIEIVLGDLPGDFNNDERVDNLDIDILRGAVINMTSDAQFNVDGSGDPNIPNEGDFDFLISSLIGTLPGDTDLNFVVNFDDFVRVSDFFMQVNTNWDQGNLNVSAATNFEDFVVLSNSYGQSLLSSQSNVPEPALLTMLVAMTAAASLGPRTDTHRLKRRRRF